MEGPKGEIDVLNYNPADIVIETITDVPMNYLAHLYLSGNHPEIQMGNFIGDYVKGSRHDRYTGLVQKGILLHRKIDAFTDRHPRVKMSGDHLKLQYNRYSGVVVDLFYDHFLADNWTSYSDIPLQKFVSSVHMMLMKNYFRLPGEVRSFLPFLIKSRRLENYRHPEGIERALTIMTQYSSLPSHVDFAMDQFRIHYNDFRDDFQSFFEDVRVMVDGELAGVIEFD
jgi:acyl carrier protein phosphodiesterase